MNKTMHTDTVQELLQPEDQLTLEALIKDLEGDRVHLVVTRYFGFSGEPQTYGQTADVLGISAVRVQQLAAKQMRTWSVDNRLYVLARRLVDAGIAQGTHANLVENGMHPGKLKAMLDEVRQQNLKERVVARFLLECHPECSSHRPCQTCQTKVLLEDVQLLEQVEVLARSFYGEVMSMHDIPVRVFDFSVRTANCLRNEHIRTLGELLQWSERELLRVPNFGRKSLNEIKEQLADLGLELVERH